MEGRLKPRQQGDLGELSAMTWLTEKGANVFKPVFHSPNIDLVADLGDRLISVEVKTATSRRGRAWCVSISTKGGNQSWNGVIKYFDPARCDYLFVHVGDGRRWFIPTGALEARSGIHLGGPKYAEFEIEQTWPLQVPLLESDAAKGEYRSGQPGGAVNAVAQSFAGSNPASPILPTSPIVTERRFKPTQYERRLGKSGRAVINQKRRVTLPQSALVDAGLRDGDCVTARADAEGRIVLEKTGLPVWAEAS
jgi:hypothetical protein